MHLHCWISSKIRCDYKEVFFMDEQERGKKVIKSVKELYQAMIGGKITQVVKQKSGDYCFSFGVSPTGTLIVQYNETRGRAYIVKYSGFSTKVRKRLRLTRQNEKDILYKKRRSERKIWDDAHKERSIQELQERINEKIAEYPMFKAIQVDLEENNWISFNPVPYEYMYIVKKIKRFEILWKDCKKKYSEDINVLVNEVIDTLLCCAVITDDFKKKVFEYIKNTQSAIQDKLKDIPEVMADEYYELLSYESRIFINDMTKEHGEYDTKFIQCCIENYPVSIRINYGPFKLVYNLKEQKFAIYNEQKFKQKMDNIMSEYTDLAKRRWEYDYFKKVCNIAEDIGLKIVSCNGLPRITMDKQKEIIFIAILDEKDGIMEKERFAIHRDAGGTLPDISIIADITGKVKENIRQKKSLKLEDFCRSFKEKRVDMHILDRAIVDTIRANNSCLSEKELLTVLRAQNGLSGINRTRFSGCFNALPADVLKNEIKSLVKLNIIKKGQSKLCIGGRYEEKAFYQACEPLSFDSIKAQFNEGQKLRDIDYVTYMKSLNPKDLSDDDWLKWVKLLDNVWLFNVYRDDFIAFFGEMSDVVRNYLEIAYEMCDKAGVKTVYNEVLIHYGVLKAMEKSLS